MNLPRFYNLRFLLALPWMIVADLCADYLARADTELANAINGPEDSE